MKAVCQQIPVSATVLWIKEMRRSGSCRPLILRDMEPSLATYSQCHAFQSHVEARAVFKMRPRLGQIRVRATVRAGQIQISLDNVQVADLVRQTYVYLLSHCLKVAPHRLIH